MILFLHFLSFLCTLNAMPDGIYCGKESCYDVLGLSRDATNQEIKKSYRQLAKAHHPDKFHSHDDFDKAEIEKKFRLIASAYETLRNEDSRKEYDYMLDNPDYMYYNYYRYYRRKYAPMYIGQWTSYNSAINYMMRDHKKRASFKDIALRQGLMDFNRKKLSKTAIRDKEEQILRQVLIDNVDFRGDCERPSLWRVLGLRLIMLPVSIGKLIWSHLVWIWKYKIKRHEYDLDAKVYLTRCKLGLTLDKWESLNEKNKEEYLSKELWIAAKFENFLREESERKAALLGENSNYKRYLRYIKKNS